MRLAGIGLHGYVSTKANQRFSWTELSSCFLERLRVSPHEAAHSTGIERENVLDRVERSATQANCWGSLEVTLKCAFTALC